MKGKALKRLETAPYKIKTLLFILYFFYDKLNSSKTLIYWARSTCKTAVLLQVWLSFVSVTVNNEIQVYQAKYQDFTDELKSLQGLLVLKSQRLAEEELNLKWFKISETVLTQKKKELLEREKILIQQKVSLSLRWSSSMAFKWVKLQCKSAAS